MHQKCDRDCPTKLPHNSDTPRLYSTMTSLLLTIATLLLNLTPTTHAQSTTTSNNPYSCIDPLNLYTTEVRKGENTTVCLYVGPDGDWNSDISYKRFSVNLVADEFSSYRIPGCEFSVCLDVMVRVSCV